MADSSVYTVAQYIIDRLTALGVKHIFQVPGNYTAQFLLRAQRSGRIQCVGTTNEMEAGYAADAYARLHGIGVACTTYGVGSFSLYNAIAGARVERCPVVLINGGPNKAKSDDLENRGILFAHAIDTSRTDERIFREITAATAVVTDPEEAPRQIDHVLHACITEKMPVYLEVRDGVWEEPCREPENPPADQPLKALARTDELQRRIDLSVDAAVQATLAKLNQSKIKVLWGGEELQRFKLESAFETLIELTGLPYTTTLMGKSLVRETNGKKLERRPEFIGVYDSGFAPEAIRIKMNNADCVLALGTILSDFYGHIVQTTEKADSLILAAGSAVRVGRALYPNAPLDEFLPKLIAMLRVNPLERTSESSLKLTTDLPSARFERSAGMDATDATPTLALSWKQTFDQLQSHIDDKTYVLVDTSIGLFPSAELLIPGANHFIAQTAWLSIGYTTGAAVGVSTLLKPEEHILVLVGDGGFQMGPQSLATLAKIRKPVTMVVFDNAIYGIEQFLVVTAITRDELDFYQPDSTRPSLFFNNLALDNGQSTPAREETRWDYESLARAFGCYGKRVSTMDELNTELDAAKTRLNQPTLIAVRVDPRSVPPELESSVQLRMMAAGAVAIGGGVPPPIGLPLSLMN